MNFKRIGGHVGRLGAGGYQLDLNSADVASIASATSSFVRSVAVTTVGMGIGIAFLNAVFGSRQKDDYPELSMPLSGFVAVRNIKRQFVGIILNNCLHFECDGQMFEVSIDRVLQLESYAPFNGEQGAAFMRAAGGDRGYASKNKNSLSMIARNYKDLMDNVGKSPDAWKYFQLQIGLVDYSSYYPVTIKDESIEFLSVAGKQMLKMDQMQPFYIHGVTVSNVKALRERLRFAVKSTRSQSIKLLGEDIYKRYFSE